MGSRMSPVGNVVYGTITGGTVEQRASVLDELVLAGLVRARKVRAAPRAQLTSFVFQGNQRPEVEAHLRRLLRDELYDLKFFFLPSPNTANTHPRREAR